MMEEFSEVAKRIEEKDNVSPLGKEAFLAILHRDYRKFDKLHVRMKAKKIGMTLLIGGKKP
ncbi:hypothetical protein [Acidithiobacillus caldus]|uniref:Uncharacterized protein n=1 Tax=Acidithiobacillus caldus TaxID=33059 RepID=A0A1E7YN47_9PROT|nr:hypothetical protein [Acidithiobacillus caldus]OFC35528.1 hypothetical protein BAE29_15355 [Acidithiobacillus caldus]OFC36377.1 hypothetical protein BAE27_06255 [Acidithiobacillus caldus]OFC40443.1 hypothetical protein BAE28_00075 [Acidithiobacillus caldus]OFC62453.1 hypothetical protein BAE30_01895 [Acidithiobacillus caldus]